MAKQSEKKTRQFSENKIFFLQSAIAAISAIYLLVLLSRSAL